MRKLKMKPVHINRKHKKDGKEIITKTTEVIPPKKNRTLVFIAKQNGAIVHKWINYHKNRFRYDNNSYLIDRNYAFINRNKQLTYLYFEGCPMPVSHKAFEYEMVKLVEYDDKGEEITTMQSKVKGLKYDSVEVDALTERQSFDEMTKNQVTIGNLILIVLQIVGIVMMGIIAYGVFK